MLFSVRPRHKEALPSGDDAVAVYPVSPPLSRKQETATTARVLRVGLIITWLVVGGTALFAGMDYYLIPLHDRPYSDLHELFKPSGIIGHGMGVVGSLMLVVGVVSYSVRKRMHRLSSFGKLRNWLQFHIFLCTLGPFLVLLHTSFRVGGLVSIAFWSMVIVVLSGIFGRYLYVRIPKAIGGEFLSRQAVERRHGSLAHALQTETGLDRIELEPLLHQVPVHSPKGFLDALRLAVRYDLTRRRGQRDLEHRLALLGLNPAAYGRSVALLREHQSTVQQMTLMQAFHKLFGYWHILHLPLAIVMFAILIVHIVVAAVFGYAWIF